MLRKVHLFRSPWILPILPIEIQGSSATVTRSKHCRKLLGSKSGCCIETPVELFERNTRAPVPRQFSGSWERMIENGRKDRSKDERKKRRSGQE